MTNQEAFDVVYKHLLKQMIHTDNYRGDNGLQCAIGALIPDAEYKPQYEGVGAGSLALMCKSLRCIEPRLLNHLQMINDLVPPERWQVALEECAQYFRLTVPTKTGFQLKLPLLVGEAEYAGA